MPIRLWVAILAPALAFAQAAPPSTETRLANLETAVKSAQSAGDNAWMLVSSALVLMMTGPGLALFYGGLVRKKNVLGTFMQSFSLMALVTVIWALVGYSLCFGSGNAFIGGLKHLFLRGVGSAPDPDYAATIPNQTFMVYQLMFAIITPALITGAFAERMKFSAMAAFTTLWTLLVYAPMAHMVWGKGGLLNSALGGVIPTLDFAGGTVVHVTSGVSALVCALYLGRRLGYPKTAMPPHSVVLSFVGACLLWVGWFGFNAGSALAAVAGLVAITPASGFVAPMPALAIGLIAGVVCYYMVAKVKGKFGYDDSLDAFGVHGAGGTAGAFLTGIFASSAVNAVFKDSKGLALPVGLIEGNWRQVLNQLAGVGIAWVLAIVGSLAILKLVDMVIGLRLSEEEEDQGLDLSQHGEEGYILSD